MRRQAIAALILALSGAGVSAQEAGTGRYQVEPSVDGFIRLDTETGAVSHCNRRDGVWRCDVLAADNGAIEEVAAEVRALGVQLDALTERVDAIEAKKAAPPEAAAEPPAPGFANSLMGPLFQLVRDIRRQQSS